MKRTSFLPFAVVLVFRTMYLKSQSAVCGEQTFEIVINCPPPYPPCSFNVAAPASDVGIWYAPQSIKCCNITQYNYVDTGQCVTVYGKLNQPALQRLLEYAKTHEMLAATCDGRYLPAQAVLRMPAHAAPPPRLWSQRISFAAHASLGTSGVRFPGLRICFPRQCARRPHGFRAASASRQAGC